MDIVPHLWFDRDAVAAAKFYADLLPGGTVHGTATLPGTPGGDSEVVSFRVGDLDFLAINAGPVFTPTPAISFLLNFDPSQDKEAEARLRTVWDKLCNGGKVLMPLQEYPWAKLHGWVQDRWGFTWQPMLTHPEGEPRPRVIPALTFAGAVSGKAEQAIRHYVATFPKSKVGNLAPTPPGQGKGLMFGEFQACGQWFAAMDSGLPHKWGFNEAVSLLVRCKDQQEMDLVFDALSADPRAEQCGWLKDRHGVSWQVAPADMAAMMLEGSKAQVAAVTKAFLPMKRLDVAKIRKAYEAAAK